MERWLFEKELDQVAYERVCRVCGHTVSESTLDEAIDAMLEHMEEEHPGGKKKKKKKKDGPAE